MNKRHWLRFPQAGRTAEIVLAGDDHQTAEILDESWRGLCLRATTSPELMVGSEIDLREDGHSRCATVRYIADEADGTCRIGVEYARMQVAS